MPHAKVGENDIYYEVHEAQVPGKLPAVFVMGLGTDAHAWEKQIEAFAGKRPLLVLDNRGVGRSSKPPGPYTIAGLADDLAGVLEAAGIETAHVVGISLGGMIAQELALRHPKRVRSLALLATYAKPDVAVQDTAEKGAGGKDPLQMMMAGRKADGGVDLQQVFSFLTKRIFSRAYLARETTYLQTFFIRSLGYGISLEAIGAQVAAALAHDSTDRLGAIQAPTLVATGTADALIAPHHSKTLADAIPSARYVEIPDGSHALTLEHADAVNVLLEGWFSDTEA